MDKILIHVNEATTIKSKSRVTVLVECPDCSNQRTIRQDSFNNSKTTCCRSCLNLRRPTKRPEDLFNYNDYYRTKEGKLSFMYQAQKQRCKLKNMPLPSYNQKQFIDWAMSKSIYHTLFNNWVLSNYSKEFSPSIDRIDDYKSYSFDNIRIVTWKDNNEKGKLSQKLGLNRKNSIEVIQLDKEGNVLNTYYSISNASRETGLVISGIAKASNPDNPRQTCGGYYWRRN